LKKEKKEKKLGHGKTFNKKFAQEKERRIYLIQEVLPSKFIC